MGELLVFKNEDGLIVTSSRDIAERFGKKHKHVLDKIDLAISNLHSAEKSAKKRTY